MFHCCFPCPTTPKKASNNQENKTQPGSSGRGQPGIKSLRIDKSAVSTTRTATASPKPNAKTQLDPELYKHFTKSVTSDTSYSRTSNLTVHDYVTKAKFQSMNSVESENETLDGVVQQSKTPSNLVRIKTMDAVIRRAASASRSEEYIGELAHIVFMGCCNSGKSTIVKQMRSLYLGRVTRNFASSAMEHEELGVYKKLMFDQIMALLKQISHKAVTSLQTKIADILINLPIVEENIAFIDDLKQDPLFQEAINNLSKNGSFESAKYLVDNMARILADYFEPNEIDILKTRDPTMSASTEVMQADENHSIRIYDFGGFKFQRSKWVAQLSAVKCDACIFVHSLACFDLKSDEDNSLNQMADSFDVYNNFINSESLIHTPVILILNKKDLFLEKLKLSNFRNHIPDFKGDPKNANAVLEYIKNEFKALTDNASQRDFHIVEVNSLDRVEISSVIKRIVKLACNHRALNSTVHSL